MPLEEVMNDLLDELDRILREAKIFGPVDVVENPKIAPSNNYGNYTGGTFGCTRNNSQKRCNNVNGVQRHTGVDIHAPLKSKIKSIYKGKLVEIRNTFSPGQYLKGSLGNYVVIKTRLKTGNDVYLKYCHLDKIYFKQDDQGKEINGGDYIGELGSTGNAANNKNPSRTHVHIEFSVGGKFFSAETRVDPMQYLKTQFDLQGNVIN